MSDDWVWKDLMKAENKISELEDDVLKLKSITQFLLEEMYFHHVEEKRHSCSPHCPTCKFYKEMRN